MLTTAQSNTFTGIPYISRERNISLLTRFMNWAGSQEEYRFIWIGVVLLAHASFLTPFTAMAVMLTTESFPLLMVALGSMGLALVTNLAALPTKITIPAFFLSIAIDVVVVALTFLAIG